MNSVAEAAGNVDYAAIIAVAAQSPFGILALLIIGVSFAACILFWNASDSSRMFAFFLLFFGMSAFGSAVFYERLEQEKYLRIQAETAAEEEKRQLEGERKRRHELVLEELRVQERTKAQQAELAIKQREIDAKQEAERLVHEKRMEELRQEEERCKPRQKVVRTTIEQWIEESAEENSYSNTDACRKAKRAAKAELNDECDDMSPQQVGSGVISKVRTSSDCECEDLRSYFNDPSIYCDVERKGFCTYTVEETKDVSPCT